VQLYRLQYSSLTHTKNPFATSDSCTDMDPVKSETRDGMRIDWDVSIAMDDGIVL